MGDSDGAVLPAAFSSHAPAVSAETSRLQAEQATALSALTAARAAEAEAVARRDYSAAEAAVVRQREAEAALKAAEAAVAKATEVAAAEAAAAEAEAAAAEFAAVAAAAHGGVDACMVGGLVSQPFELVRIISRRAHRLKLTIGGVVHEGTLAQVRDKNRAVCHLCRPEQAYLLPITRPAGSFILLVAPFQSARASAEADDRRRGA
jgi:multidrug efflux pump subunit AcrA (membrane-fusion protein)